MSSLSNTFSLILKKEAKEEKDEDDDDDDDEKKSQTCIRIQAFSALVNSIQFDPSHAIHNFIATQN